MTKKVLGVAAVIAIIAIFYFLNTGKNMFTQEPVPVPEVEVGVEE